MELFQHLNLIVTFLIIIYLKIQFWKSKVLKIIILYIFPKLLNRNIIKFLIINI